MGHGFLLLCMSGNFDWILKSVNVKLSVSGFCILLLMSVELCVGRKLIGLEIRLERK